MRLKKRIAALLALTLLLALLPVSALAMEINDPMVSDQWGLEAIHAFEAWDLIPSDAEPVTVAVLDGGFDLTHEDLADCYYRANGKIVQYDALDDDYEIAPDSHGTHVAGIIAAVTGNGVGVAGVTGNHAKILPVQMLTSLLSAGDSRMEEGFRFVLDYAQEHPEANIRVISVSIGAAVDTERGLRISSLAELINEAYYEYGILTVYCAGNEAYIYNNGNGYMQDPIDWAENAVGVIAVEPAEDGGEPVRTFFSNYNMPGQRTKDLSAPGVDILNTYWESNRESEAYRQSFYKKASGTSMATPCVAGVAALMFAANPDLTAAEAKELLCATAQPIHEDEGIYENGFSLDYGWGMVDAEAAVRAATDFLRGPAALLAGDSIELIPVTGCDEQDGAAWSWTSSDGAVAAVSADGVVTGLAGGEAVITATKDGRSLTKRITVYAAAFSGPDEAVLGEVAPLTFTSFPVRDEWILKEGPVEDYVACDRSASKGDGETIRLYAEVSGTATLTATLATDRSVQVIHSVEFLPADIADAEIAVENQPWTGEPAEPDPEVWFNAAVPENFGQWTMGTQYYLEKGVDYTLSYEDNDAPGIGTVIVTGIDRFTGTARAEFKIRNDYFVEDDVEFDIPAAPYVYDGTGHTPGVTVIHGGVTLTEDVDYRVDYRNNVDAGTAWVTVQGIDDWAGYAERSFEIAPADITDRESFKAVRVFNQPYANGERLRPGVKFADMRIPDGEQDFLYLEEGADFTISYENNVGVKGGAVTATATVTGVGNYVGERTYSFIISDKVVTQRNFHFELPEGGFVYTGEAYEPDFTVTYDGVTLTEDTDYVIASGYRENIDAGWAYIWIVTIGEYAGWYEPETYGYSYVCGFFEIAPADLADVEIAAVAAQAYTGAAVEPDVAATYNGMTLERDTDYELSYANNVGPGTGTVTVTGLGNYTGEVTVTFSITGGDPGGYDVGPAPAEQKDAEQKDDARTETPAVTYTDVPAGAWYADSVAFVTEKGLFEGFGDGTFRPEAEMDRAMAVQVLWKLAGKPGADPALPFADVADGDWYAEAVRWACAVGITNGTGEGFEPDAPVTREQFAAMVYRFVQLSGKGFTGMWSFRLDFPDAGNVSDWAREGVSWLVMNGILKGMDGELNPQGVLTRAQTAALLQRVAEMLA